MTAVRPQIFHRCGNRIRQLGNVAILCKQEIRYVAHDPNAIGTFLRLIRLAEIFPISIIPVHPTNKCFDGCAGIRQLVADNAIFVLQLCQHSLGNAVRGIGRVVVLAGVIRSFRRCHHPEGFGCRLNLPGRVVHDRDVVLRAAPRRMAHPVRLQRRRQRIIRIRRQRRQANAQACHNHQNSHEHAQRLFGNFHVHTSFLFTIPVHHLPVIPGPLHRPSANVCREAGSYSSGRSKKAYHIPFFVGIL